MPADLTREEIERIRNGHAATGVWTADDAAALLQHALSEPTRLAAARAEGYREGYREEVEAAARWHDEPSAPVAPDLETAEGRAATTREATIRVQSTRVTALEAENAALRERNEKLVEGLEFYADPDSYIAISFLSDLPCGEFMEDFDEDHGNPFFDRPMPGSRARALLQGGADAATV